MYRHAHWNCSGGATGHAMLAACVHAVKTLAPASDSWMEELTKLQREWFGFVTVVVEPSPGGTEAVDFEVKGALPASSQTSWFDGAPSSLERDNTWDTLYMEAIQELIRTRKRINVDDNLLCDDALSSALFTVSVLWCLQRLGVQSISYSSLPLGTDGSDASRRNESLLIGLNVTPVTSTESFFCECAVTLLKVSQIRPGSSAAPQMTLSCVSRGHDRNLNLQVTLTIGTLPLEETTARDRRSDVWNLDRMLLLETNIDDMTAEHLQFCVERLHSAGASDAWTTAIGMKKGRAAQSLHCLCREPLRDKMLSVLFRHSSTLGVRLQTVERAALHRRTIAVKTQWNDAIVDVKVAYLRNGKTEEVASIKAEFDHCRAISLATDMPIQAIADEAVRLAKELMNVSLPS